MTFGVRNKINVLKGLQGIVCFLMLFVSHAQTDTVQRLEEVEVIGELSPELSGNLSRHVEVIDRSQMELLPLYSLQALLNSAVQVDIRQRGNWDVQSDISLNGSTFDQVQVLLNGFDVTDPQTGHHSFNLPVSLSQIEQVQILSGASTRAMGVNAYAGTINFITPLEDQNKLVIKADAGSFGYINLTASTHLAVKKIKSFLSVNRSSAKGHIQNTDFKRSSIFYHSKLNTGSNSVLEWQMSFMDKAFGANSFYTPKFPHQFEQLRTGFAGIRFQTRGKISTKSSVHYRGNADRFELFRDNTAAPSWYKNHNYHFSQLLQANSRAWAWTKLGKTTIAANYRLDKIMSNVLGETIFTPKAALFDNDGFYNKKASRSYVNLSLEQSYVWDKLKISGGMMYYFFLTGINTPKNIFPGIDITYHVSNNLQFFAGMNTGMRLPTFTDLYYDGPSNIGNPDLVPETQTTLQGGGKYKTRAIEIKINGFTDRAINAIDWVRKNDTVQWQPINVTKVKATGFAFSIGVSPQQAHWKKLNWIKSASLQWAFQNKTTSSPGYLSHYVLDYLKNKVTLTLQHQLYRNLYIGYAVRYQQRTGKFLHYDPETQTVTPQDYQPFLIADMRMNWKHNNWLVHLSVNNIFDVRYQDYGNISQPGRGVILGMKNSFDF